jgi:hypothetical protein
VKFYCGRFEGRERYEEVLISVKWYKRRFGEFGCLSGFVNWGCVSGFRQTNRMTRFEYSDASWWWWLYESNNSFIKFSWMSVQTTTLAIQHSNRYPQRCAPVTKSKNNDPLNHPTVLHANFITVINIITWSASDFYLVTLSEASSAMQMKTIFSFSAKTFSPRRHKHTKL